MRNMLHYHILVSTAHGKTKKLYKRFQFVGQTCGMKKLKYLIIYQGYFEYTIKKHEALSDNHPVQFCNNKVKNNTTFEIKLEYYVQLLASETMKLFASKEKR